MHPSHQAFDTSGGGPFALPGHSDQQQLQGVNPQWQQVQQDGSARHAYANNAAGTNYTNFAPQLNQPAGIYPSPNADFAPPMAPMPPSNNYPIPSTPTNVPGGYATNTGNNWKFPSPTKAISQLQLLHQQYIEQQELVGQAVATMLKVQHLQQQPRPMVQPHWLQPMQQPAAHFNAVFPQQQQMQPNIGFPLKQPSLQLRPNDGYLQPQQQVLQLNDGIPPQLQNMQHNNGFPQQHEMMAQRHDSSLDLMQPVQPTSPHNISNPPSVASHPVCPPVNGDLAEDFAWQHFLDNGSNRSTDGAMPAAAANNYDDEVVSPTRSLSMVSPQAVPTPWSPQNRQLLPPPPPPMAGAPATAACESEGAQPLSPLSPLQPPYDLKTRPKSAPGGSITSHQGQVHLSTGHSRFEPSSVNRRTHRAIFLFPGKNDMVHLDLPLAMDGFSEDLKSSQTSIRHFVKHILKKVYEDPNASTYVTAVCEKSSKGFKILPEASIAALASFWISHFKSTNIHGLKEVADAMGLHIKTYLNSYRLAQKTGRKL